MEQLAQRFGFRIYRFLQAPISSFRANNNVRLMTTDDGGRDGICQDLTLGEKQLINKLQESFPNATEIQVSDVSGGCGAMYQILIEAPDFNGKRTVMQHRMVNEALKEEIKEMHGLQLTTKATKGK